MKKVTFALLCASFPIGAVAHGAIVTHSHFADAQISATAQQTGPFSWITDASDGRSAVATDVAQFAGSMQAAAVGTVATAQTSMTYDTPMVGTNLHAHVALQMATTAQAGGRAVTTSWLGVGMEWQSDSAFSMMLTIDQSWTSSMSLQDPGITQSALKVVIYRYVDRAGDPTNVVFLMDRFFAVYESTEVDFLGVGGEYGIVVYHQTWNDQQRDASLSHSSTVNFALIAVPSPGVSSIALGGLGLFAPRPRRN